MQGFFRTVAALGVCAVALMVSTALAHAAKGPQLPSTRCVLKVMGSDAERSYASLPDAFQQLKAAGAAEFHSARVLDYATYGSKSEKLIDASRAYFLVNTHDARGGSGALQIVAFASREAAVKQQRKLGGDLRDFADAWDAVTEFYEAAPAVQESVPSVKREERARRVYRQSSADCFT
jgi:hypothetical protein